MFSRFKQCHTSEERHHKTTFPRGCNPEQLTRKSCPVPDPGDKGILLPPPWQTHHSQCRVSTACSSLRTIPAQSIQGTAWNLLCLMSPAEAVDFKGLCPTPLGSFSSKEKFNKTINTRRTMSIIIHSSILLVPHENPSGFKKQTSSLCWFLRTFKAT